MKQIFLILILPLLIAFITLSDIFAQQQTVKLWTDSIPGSVHSSSYVESTEKGFDNLTRVYCVSVPELIVYPASGEKATGTAIIICPGGGYHHLAIEHEGYNIAKWLNGLGVTAFVLKYRLPSDIIMKNKSIGPLQDAIRAMRIVRGDAEKWGINPEKIGIMGFSAGGHLASTLSTHYDDKLFNSEDSVSARPDFSILVYPVISMEESFTHMGTRKNLLGEDPEDKIAEYFSNERMVNERTPPAFLIHAADDDAVPVCNTINYFTALNKHGIPVEMHIYEKGGHGFGLKNKQDDTAYWLKDCEHWLKMHKLIK